MFSRHDNFSQAAALQDLSAGLSIPLGSRFLLKAGLHFFHMRFMWNALDGYGSYESSNWEKRAYYGPVVDYTQEWLVVSPLLSLRMPLAGLFSGTLAVEFSFMISPVVFCYDTVDHLLTLKQYKDSPSGGLFLEPGADLSFTPNSRLEFILHAAYRYIAGSRGNSVVKDIANSGGSDGSSYRLSKNAGAGYKVFDLGFSARLSF
jgi:hypothetical protein